METARAKGDWYCPGCKAYVSGSQVTAAEVHDTCSTPVIWHAAGVPASVYEAAPALLAYAEVQSAMDRYNAQPFQGHLKDKLVETAHKHGCVSNSVFGITKWLIEKRHQALTQARAGGKS